jgi:glycosyltransferase involved in cell wall biosynthesis
VAGDRGARQPPAREPLHGGLQIATVLFYRDFKRLTGGDLKVWHYFNHVRSSGRHRALVQFSVDSVWDASNPWNSDREDVIGPGEDVDFDVLFLSGIDWRAMIPIEQRDEYRRPIINIVQHIWHACPNDRLNRHRFLPHKAIRICVGPEIAKAILHTGRVRGPVFTIPNALDVDALTQLPQLARDIDLLVAANKQPELGRAVAARLAHEGRTVELVTERIPREELLRLMRRARVTVLLPNPKEGFYLPALEGMALGTGVVCPDCIGNRSFCLPGENCFRPEYGEDAIVAAAEEALGDEARSAALRSRALETVRAHDLPGERRAFLDILDRVDDLWTAA